MVILASLLHNNYRKQVIPLLHSDDHPAYPPFLPPSPPYTQPTKISEPPAPDVEASRLIPVHKHVGAFCPRANHVTTT